MAGHAVAVRICTVPTLEHAVQDPPIRTRVGQFDSARLRYAARLARRVEKSRAAYYEAPDTRRRSCARHISELEAMFNTPSQEPAAPRHLPDPRDATKGLAAKWKALLFMVGVLLLLPLALVPANWLSARGPAREPTMAARRPRQSTEGPATDLRIDYTRTRSRNGPFRAHRLGTCTRNARRR